MKKTTFRNDVISYPINEEIDERLQCDAKLIKQIQREFINVASSVFIFSKKKNYVT